MVQKATFNGPKLPENSFLPFGDPLIGPLEVSHDQLTHCGWSRLRSHIRANWLAKAPRLACLGPDNTMVTF